MGDFAHIEGKDSFEVDEFSLSFRESGLEGVVFIFLGGNSGLELVNCGFQAGGLFLIINFKEISSLELNLGVSVLGVVAEGGARQSLDDCES